MSATVVAKVPSPAELLAQYPLPAASAALVANKNEALKRILDGHDPSRKILIVGPCSADFEDSLVEYARRLAALQEEVRDRIEIVMRFYTGKPRTVDGWKGISHTDPGASGSNMADCIPNVRGIALRLLAQGVGLADEMLHPQLAPYVQDLLSWVAVGARSTENQYHREVASGMDCPVGFKNPTGGSLKAMVNSVEAAQNSTHYVDPWTRAIMKTSGNKWAHGILRGGEKGPNYGLEHVRAWLADVAARGGRLGNPALIVDCSHENCVVDGKKDPARQALVLAESAETILPALAAEGLDPVKGFMLESYLISGKSDPKKGPLPGEYELEEGYALPLGTPGSLRGKSLTEPCLSWGATRDAVLALHGALARLAIRP